MVSLYRFERPLYIANDHCGLETDYDKVVGCYNYRVIYKIVHILKDCCAVVRHHLLSNFVYLSGRKRSKSK